MSQNESNTGGLFSRVLMRGPGEALDMVNGLIVQAVWIVFLIAATVLTAISLYGNWCEYRDQSITTTFSLIHGQVGTGCTRYQCVSTFTILQFMF